MNIKPPSSDVMRLGFVDEVLQNAAKAKATGLFPISQTLTNEATALQLSLRNAWDSLKQAVDQRAAAVEQRTFETGMLTQTIRLIRQDLQKHVTLGTLEKQILAQIKLSLTKIDFRPNSALQWVQLGEQLIKGLSKVETQETPLPISPTTTELQARIDAAIAATDVVKDAKAHVKDAQLVMRQEREKVRRFHSVLANFIRYAMTGESAPVIRDVMRTYGFVFETVRQTDEEPTDPNTGGPESEPNPESPAPAEQEGAVTA